MTERNAFLKLLIGAAIAGVAGSTPATAQCRLCDSLTIARDADSPKDEIRVEVETSLNFDRLILHGEGEGTAVLRPDGSRTSAGTVAEMSPRAIAGTVTIHGDAGRNVRIELPRRIVLHSLGGGEVIFDNVTSDLPSMPRLDSMGNLKFRFGGRLRVRGDAEGEYQGDLAITAEYL